MPTLQNQTRDFKVALAFFTYVNIFSFSKNATLFAGSSFAASKSNKVGCHPAIQNK